MSGNPDGRTFGQLLEQAREDAGMSRREPSPPAPSPSQTFGEVLRSARIAEELSVADVAQLLGVQSVTVRRWEEDKRAPRGRSYWRLRDLFPRLADVEIEGGPPPRPVDDHLAELANKPRMVRVPTGDDAWHQGEPGIWLDQEELQKLEAEQGENMKEETSTEVVEDALTHPQAPSQKDAMKAWTRLVFHLRRADNVNDVRNFLRLAGAMDFTIAEVLELLDEEA